MKVLESYITRKSTGCKPDSTLFFHLWNVRHDIYESRSVVIWMETNYTHSYYIHIVIGL